MTIEEMLLNNKKDKSKEKTIICEDFRICSGGCGEMVEFAKLPEHRQKYRKYVCGQCEAKRKEKYRKKKESD